MIEANEREEVAMDELQEKIEFLLVAGSGLPRRSLKSSANKTKLGHRRTAPESKKGVTSQR
jgi:hypothetical protein